MKRIILAAIMAAILAAIVLIAVMACGCATVHTEPGYHGTDEDLVAICNWVTPALEDNFNCRMTDAVAVRWGGRSATTRGKMTVWISLRGKDIAPFHVQHECLHALAYYNPNSGGEHPEVINGVTVTDIVPGWGGE